MEHIANIIQNAQKLTLYANFPQYGSISIVLLVLAPVPNVHLNTHVQRAKKLPYQMLKSGGRKNVHVT